MKTRLVRVLAAVIACTAAEARAQDGSLRAFRSDRELTRYLLSLQERPPVPAHPPLPPAVIPPSTGPESWEGLVEQWAAVITGRVTNGEGAPESGALVRIESLDTGTTTAADGSYRLVIPANRIRPGQSVTITASRTGLAPMSRVLTLQPGARLAQNFQTLEQVLMLEDAVVTGALAAREQVTNNQHTGVDEGGIVKVHGDYLVMLRRGRLFTVDVGGGRLRPVDAADAFGPEIDPGDTWYDELLVSGDNVVVIGFSYERGGTEIGLFNIDRHGRLRYRSTWHMRSDDYYSSRNYASRLAGGKLILYAPVPVGDAEDAAEWMPAMRRWHPGARDDEFRRTLRPTRIYRSGRELDEYDWPTLHTVTTCDLGGGELDCESAAVLGPESRVFYVSPSAVYVWASEWERSAGPRRASAMVYRLPLRRGDDPTALGVEGSPVDQFSFLEDGAGHLNVLVRSEGTGESMWASLWAEGDVRLLRVPLARFGDGRRDAPVRAYRLLPRPREEEGEFHNRFVGRHLLYGTGAGWMPAEGSASTLYVVPWRGGTLSQVRLPHRVERIEVMGGDAVIVGRRADNLHFTGVRLGREPRILQHYVHRQASQGELRSHGFFYRMDGPDEGVLGLPVRGPGAPGYAHLSDESAAILFLRNADAQFRALGELAAHAEGPVDDGCVASCVDWYGNARPLFLRGRTFALLGYELVEGAVQDGRLHEVRRVSFAPPAIKASER